MNIASPQQHSLHDGPVPYNQCITRLCRVELEMS
jgi:hypothetical protein